MIYRKKMRNLTVLLLLILPLIGLGIQNSMVEPTVWVIRAEGYDGNVDLATRTLLHEISGVDCIMKTTTFERLDSVPFHSDVLVLVGHGQPDGLEVSGTILPWSDLYDEIAERSPGKAVVLACHSPTDLESNIVGFSGLIDAEAGALLAAWHIKQIINPDSQYAIPLNRVLNTQREMLHPLGAVLYFVHGYYGSDDDFEDMYDYLNLDEIKMLDNYEYVEYFDYFKYWLDTYPDWTKHDVHTNCTIGDFADRFAIDIMDKEYAPGTQIDIIGHSMGGLIARELLRIHREDLQDDYQVDIGRVITLGTPHEGSYIAHETIPAQLVVWLMSWIGPNWDSILFDSFDPDSDFLTTLNENPSSYSNDIEWTTISGRDNGVGWALSYFHGGHNDIFVAEWSAHLSFAVPYYIGSINHEGLLTDSTNGDPDRPFDVVANELGPEIDSDGLSDIEERLVYGTDPDDSDSDGDGLTDWAEVNTYGTDPNDWNTDNDVISDGNEVSWGYDPLNANSPIPASSLISSVSIITSTRTVKVYVNHYPAMDYVKFYVKYKTKFGSWTSYSYMGSDHSPYTNGDYYRTWTHPTVYTRMMVMVKAYNSDGNWLGSDYHTSGINPGGGGGGGGGGHPPIE